jgi:hypothetical protein
MESEEPELNFNQMSIIASSKKEVFDVLENEGNYYLPNLGEANSDFIADIISGEKKVSST